MTGIERHEPTGAERRARVPAGARSRGPVIGLVGLVFAGAHIGDPDLLSIARTVTGALFLGVVTDAMPSATGTSCSPACPETRSGSS